MGEHVTLSPSIAFLGRRVRVTDCTGEVAGSSPAVSTMTGRSDWIISGPGTPDHVSLCLPAVTACPSCLLVGWSGLLGRGVWVIWHDGAHRAVHPAVEGSSPSITSNQALALPIDRTPADADGMVMTMQYNTYSSTLCSTSRHLHALDMVWRGGVSGGSETFGLPRQGQRRSNSRPGLLACRQSAD